MTRVRIRVMDHLLANLACRTRSLSIERSAFPVGANKFRQIQLPFLERLFFLLSATLDN